MICQIRGSLIGGVADGVDGWLGERVVLCFGWPRTLVVLAASIGLIALLVWSMVASAV